MLGALERIVGAFGVALIVDENLHVVHFSVAFHGFVQEPEIKVFLTFLGPFKQSTLEVGFGLFELLKVNVDADDAVDDDVL